MRLLHTETLSFQEFTEFDVPNYIILSHRWEEHEITSQDFLAGKKDCQGYRKVENACAAARLIGMTEWIWIDTCCINNESSTEFSEAINSMYRWYQDALICFVYMSDVPHPLIADCELWIEEERKAFLSSKWFERWWTLQELVTPREVLFMDSSWQLLGNKRDLMQLIAEATGIPEEAFQFGLRPCNNPFSVAQKMSWASRRQTTRREDIAYCLLGIFAINMPLLYCEGGPAAFTRLQEEIIKSSDDESIFAFQVSLDGERLAQHPWQFRACASVQTFEFYERPHYFMSNKGLHIDVHMLHYVNDSQNVFVIPLNCTEDELCRYPMTMTVRKSPSTPYTLKLWVIDLLPPPLKFPADLMLVSIYIDRRRRDDNPRHKKSIHWHRVGLDPWRSQENDTHTSSTIDQVPDEHGRRSIVRRWNSM